MIIRVVRAGPLDFRETWNMYSLDGDVLRRCLRFLRTASKTLQTLAVLLTEKTFLLKSSARINKCYRPKRPRLGDNRKGRPGLSKPESPALLLECNMSSPAQRTCRPRWCGL